MTNNNIKLSRKSDRIHIIDHSPIGVGSALCPNCREVLSQLKGDEHNLVCNNCGERVSIRSIRQTPKLVQVDNPDITGIVQPQADKWKRGIQQRKRNPIEAELQDRYGFEIKDSTWEDQRRR